MIPTMSCVPSSLCPALTVTPDFQIMPTLVSGTSTQLICSLPWACERGTPPVFSWMASALTSLGPGTTLSSELKLTPRPQDHGTNITCQVTFPSVGVTVERTEQLSVTCECQARNQGLGGWDSRVQDGVGRTG